MTQRYYPNSHPPRLNEDLRLLYDHVYRMQDQLAQAYKRIGELEKPAPKNEDAGSPSHTKIAGLYVKGTPPQDGQKLTYVAASGQIEWQ
jgi:hypothetical protein